MRIIFSGGVFGALNFSIFKKKPFSLIVAVLLILTAFPVQEAYSSESLVIQRYKKALEADPENLDIRLQLTLAFLKDSMYPEAIEHLKVLHKALPAEPEINYYIGVAYAGNMDLDQAYGAFSKVEEYDPKNAVSTYELDKVFYNLGISYQKSGQMNSALKSYRRSLQLDPSSSIAQCRLGEVSYELKDYAGAIESLAICSQKYPHDARARRYTVSTRLSKGLSLIEDKRYDEALLDFKKALELDPENEDGLYFLGYLYYQLNSFRQAQATLEKLSDSDSIELLENLPPLLQNVGMELQKREDWAFSAKAFKQALSFRRKSPDLHFLLGTSYERLGDYQNAMDEMKEALRLDPGHQKAILALAVITEELLEQQLARGENEAMKGNHSAALAIFENALRIDPLSQRASKGLREAEGHLKAMKYEVMKKREEELKARLEYGMKQLTDGQYQDALSSFRYILAIDPANSGAVKGRDRAEAFINEARAKHLAAGDQFSEQQNLLSAYKEYKKAYGYAPDDKEVRARLERVKTELASKVKALTDKGGALEEKKLYSEAVKAYDEALKYDPEYRDAISGRTRASAASAKKQEIAKVSKPVERVHKAYDRKDVEKLYLEGIELYTEGRYTDAIRKWEKVLEYDSGHEKASFNIEKAKRKLEGVMSVK